MARGNGPADPIKIAFPYGQGVETMWANPLEDGTYEVDNSPFEVYGISYRDVIAARPEEGRLVFDRVVRHGGHSTYRIKLNAGAGHDLFLKYWPELALLGCTFEGTGTDPRRLYAIDVPQISVVPRVYAYLEKLEENGVWEFEEAHYFRPQVQSG